MIGIILSTVRITDCVDHLYPLYLNEGGRINIRTNISRGVTMRQTYVIIKCNGKTSKKKKDAGDEDGDRKDIKSSVIQQIEFERSNVSVNQQVAV